MTPDGISHDDASVPPEGHKVLMQVVRTSAVLTYEQVHFASVVPRLGVWDSERLPSWLGSALHVGRPTVLPLHFALVDASFIEERKTKPGEHFLMAGEDLSEISLCRRDAGHCG